MRLASQFPWDPVNGPCQGARVDGGQARALAVRGEVLQNGFHAAVVLAGIQPQLGEDIGNVLGHRGGRQDELGGDVLVGLAAGH